MTDASESRRAEQAAAVIWAAWTSGHTITELPDECRPRNAREGASSQDALETLAGARFGWKLAATWPAGQRHIGVDGPLHGRLFTRFVHDDGDRLTARGMHMRDESHAGTVPLLAVSGIPANGRPCLPGRVWGAITQSRRELRRDPPDCA
jgi:hypothetical protein